MRSALLLLGILLSPSLAGARSAGVSDRGEAMLSAAACPSLFGGGAARAANAKRRGQLYWIDQESGGVTVAHRSDEWDEPVPFEIRGVQLQSAREGRAVVELSAAGAAALGCRAGRYRLGVDDGLTRSVRVLAILDGVVLVEHGRRLAYVLASGARAPRWFLAWSAPGEVRVDPGAGSIGSDNFESPYRRYPTRGHYIHH